MENKLSSPQRIHTVKNNNERWRRSSYSKSSLEEETVKTVIKISAQRSQFSIDFPELLNFLSEREISLVLTIAFGSFGFNDFPLPI